MGMVRWLLLSADWLMMLFVCQSCSESWMRRRNVWKKAADRWRRSVEVTLSLIGYLETVSC